MMNLPPWLMALMQQRQQGAPQGFMPPADFTGQGASAPLSAGFQQGPGQLMGRPQGGPQASMGTPAGMTDQGLTQRFPAGMNAPAGPDWAGIAGAAGGLLSQLGAPEERPPMPMQVPMRQAQPMGQRLPSLYEQARSRGFY